MPLALLGPDPLALIIHVLDSDGGVRVGALKGSEDITRADALGGEGADARLGFSRVISRFK